MAKMETVIYGNFHELLNVIEQGILQGSISASLEDASDFAYDNARCAVRVFERFSWLGGNRVSLNVTLFEAKEGRIHVSAIASGGSQAMLYKVNTWGEENFLSELEAVLQRYPKY